MHPNKTEHPVGHWYDSIHMQISGLSEWHEFTSYVYSIISQRKDSYHSLSPQKQEFIIRDALQSISPQKIHSIKYKINVMITKWLEHTLDNNDLSCYQSFIYNVCEYILEMKKDTKYLRIEFLQYLNTEIPSYLRIIFWEVCLFTPKLQHFLGKIMKDNVSFQTAINNIEVSKLDLLLSQLSFCVGVIPDKVLEIMKYCLLCYFRIIFPNSSLTLQHVKLLYPFALVVINTKHLFSSSYSEVRDTRSQSIYSSFKYILISKALYLYISFLHKFPEFILSDTENYEANRYLNEFTFKLTSIIKSSDIIFYHFLCSLASNSEPQLITSISKLFRRILQDLFVGHLEMQVVFYLWDQCFFYLHNSTQFLPYTGAGWLLIFKNDIMKLNTFKEIGEFLDGKKHIVTVQHFIEIFNAIASDLKLKLLVGNKNITFGLLGDITKPSHSPITQINAADDFHSPNSTANSNEQTRFTESIQNDNFLLTSRKENERHVKVDNLNIETVSHEETLQNLNAQSNDQTISGIMENITPDNSDTHPLTDINDSAENSVESSLVNSDHLERRDIGEDRIQTLDFWIGILKGFQSGLLNIAHIDLNDDSSL